MNRPERKPADRGREELAQELHALGYSPEEYAARFAHNWYCFSLDDVRYSDPNLDAWIQRLGDILFRRPGAPEVADLRAIYLTPEERERIERRSTDDL